MTRREYLKYNNPEAFDIQGKPVKPGDTVVINNHYGSAPYIGIVDHFTESGNLAITYDYGWGSTIKCRAYRMPRTVIKIKDGNNTTNQNKEEGNPKAV